MTDVKQRIAFKEFAKNWKDKGYEKGESQKFWISLLTILGVEHPEQFISFEDQVHLDHTSFIDGYIPTTKVLIEQKSSDKDLYKPIKQSDGSLLNPFQQAKRYITELPLSKHPRWVVTCNFQKFCIYDMEHPNGEPQEILLKDIEKEYYRLSFLVDTGSELLKKEMEVSIQAGKIVGLLYDAFLNQYIDKTSEDTLKSLNILCVRLVFCLYAEDAGVFPKHNMFVDYLKHFETVRMRKAIIELFEVLNTKPEERDTYLEPELSEFPYVNGGLFANENIEIPNFTDDIRELLFTKASKEFDWSKISPTIFGAVFESTLNPETRRSGGMHYTSIKNIHKVIDPLFMDELNKEFQDIKQLPQNKNRDKKLTEFQDKISNLTFLDPACGSGNFLTETFISLRKLENEVLQELYKGQITIGAITNPIKVSIKQFYGIEINDFAVTVAKTALWIAENQMLKKTENIVHMDLDFLPLKTYANIVEANALHIDWNEVVSKDILNYIMGNPPFVGARLMSQSQKKDMILVFGDKWNHVGNLDYVSCWYKKATDYMQSTNICTALVSTNSITQGEQVSVLWKPLFEHGIHIDFAHRTFRWDNESSIKAHVHCVIIGFSYTKKQKRLYSGERMQYVNNINAYLIDAPNVFISSRKTPIHNFPKMYRGSMPNDGGALCDYSDDDKNTIVKEYHASEKFFKKFLGATEFLYNKSRWCLWLKNISPAEIKHVPPVLSAIQKAKDIRNSSNREATRKLADTPYLFGQIRQPETNYLIIPRCSSEKRKYIPIGYVTKEVICGDSNMFIADASLFTFGIMCSNVHNAWMRTICGRLEMRYRYSSTIVYNNFPYCTPTGEQKARIEKTAQAILDARALYPDCSLADLYDELTMPSELRKAHQDNDIAVMETYGFRKVDEATGKSRLLNEAETVSELIKMYQELTK